jgi:hypothetical protein
MARATVPAGSTRGQTSDDILSLPFVRDLGQTRPETRSRRHFWMPRCEELDFAAGCDLGQDYAIQALRHMVDHDCQPLLGWVALDLAALRPVGGERGAVVGFFSVFATLATWQAAAAGVDRVEAVFAERRARLAAFGAAQARAGRAAP